MQASTRRIFSSEKEFVLLERGKDVAQSGDREPRSLGVFLGLVVRHVRGSLATLTLLTLAVVSLHHTHFLDWSEGVIRRLVLDISAGRQLDQSFSRQSDPRKTVSVVMIEPYSRIRDLEMDAKMLDDKALVDRVDGARPIDRCKSAVVIESLAKRLDDAHNRQYLKVVGLDVDIAPVSEAESQRCGASIASAVAHLRAHVNVVAIVMDRETESLRNLRNDFYGEGGLACTLPETLKASPDSSEKSESPNQHHLFLASPRVFHSTYSYPIDFPSEVRPEPHSRTSAASSWNPPANSVFPSLSNVLLAAAFRSGDSYLKSATMLCEQALTQKATRASPRTQLLLEDRIGRRFSERCDTPAGGPDCLEFSLERYELRPINWRWKDSEDIQSFSVSVSQLQKIDDSMPGYDFFSAAALILGVDGGAGYDKFQGAADAIPGAMLHALQAVSVQDAGHVLYLASIWALLVDFGVGLVFLAAWKSLSLLIDWRLRGTATRDMLRLVLPVVIAFSLGLICVNVLSPALLARDVWANPLYLLAGLVMHAYVEAAEGADEAHDGDGHHHQGPDFTFGLRAAWDEWSASRRFSWHLADLVLCWLAKLAVIGFACSALLHYEVGSPPFVDDAAFWLGPAAIHWTGWTVPVLFVVMVVAFFRRPKRRSTCAAT